MTDRLTIAEFFSALKDQEKKPYIDNAESRKAVEWNVKSFAKFYPIKDRWPILDLESAYESYLNNRHDLKSLVSTYGYNGIINLDGYDERYSIEEWFGDFTIQYKLKDTPSIRERMRKIPCSGDKWRAPDIDEAYQKSLSLFFFIKKII